MNANAVVISTTSKATIAQTSEMIILLDEKIPEILLKIEENVNYICYIDYVWYCCIYNLSKANSIIIN